MRAIRRVDVPASVRDFAAATAVLGEPVDVAGARDRIRSAIAARPVLYVCRGWAGVLVAPGASAWTLGRHVLLRDGQWGVDATDSLVAHELVHVAQWCERGRLRFLLTYVGAYLRERLRGEGHWGAYRRIPAEVEAYDLEAAVEPHL